MEHKTWTTHRRWKHTKEFSPSKGYWPKCWQKKEIRSDSHN